MFVEARTDSFQAVMRIKIVSLLSRVKQKPNSILNDIAAWSDCPILNYEMEQSKGVNEGGREEEIFFFLLFLYL